MRHRELHILLTLVLGASLLLSTVGCAQKPAPGATPGTTPAPVSEKPITLKLAEYWSPSFHAIVNWVDPWANEIESRTKGRVKIERYYAEALVKAADIYEACQEGITDIGVFLPTYEAGKFPIGTIFELPFAMPEAPAGMSSEQAAKIGSDVAWAYWEKYGTQELGPNVKMLQMSMPLFYPGGPYYIFTRKKAVHTLEDLKGLQIRTPGGNVNIVKALGATPVGMTLPETYESLERGIIDGTFHLFATVHSAKLYEVLDYASDMPIIMVVVGHLVNKNSWDKLPKDVQDVISAVSKEYNHWGVWSYASVGEETRAEMGREGQLGISTVAPEEKARWEKQLLPLWDDWMKGSGPRKEAARDYMDLMQKAGYPARPAVAEILKKYQ